MVKKDEGVKLSQEHEVDFVEISAKSGDNINDLFTEISKTLCEGIIPDDQMDQINFDRKT